MLEAIVDGQVAAQALLTPQGQIILLELLVGWLFRRSGIIFFCKGLSVEPVFISLLFLGAELPQQIIACP